MKWRSALLILMSLTFYRCAFNSYARAEGLAAGNGDKIALSLKRDSTHHEAKLYLTVNNILADSITILNVNFAFDSLANFGDTLWHYIYATHGWKNMYEYEQILIEEVNHKIHFPYVGDYLAGDKQMPDRTYSFRDGDLFCLTKYIMNITDTGVSVRFSGYSSEYYDGAFQRSIGQQVPYEIIFRQDSTDGISFLQYDTANRIYYNYTDTLNGVYHLRSGARMTNDGLVRDSTIQKLTIVNEVVRAVKFLDYDLPFVYYKGNWFGIRGLLTKDMDPYPQVEWNRSMD